jgi:hypothetical protein
MLNKIYEQLQKVKIICKTAMLCKKFKNACGVIDAACTIFAFENRSAIGEFQAELGDQGVLFDEKTEGRKSRDTVPLNSMMR